MKDKLPYLYLYTVFSLTFLGIIYWPGLGLTARYLGWGLGLLLPVLIAPSFFKQRSFFFLIVYAIVVYLNYLTGDSYFSSSKKVIDGLVALYIPLGMTYYAVKSNNMNWMRAVFFVAIIVIVWMTIATALFDMQIPGVVRYIHVELQEGSADISEYKNFYAFGMSNYLLPHAIPALIPVFAIRLRQRGISFRKKIVSFALLLSIMMLLYFSGATGPLLVGIGILLLSLWLKPGKTSTNIVSTFLLVLILLPLLLSDEIMLNFLKKIDDFIGNDNYFHAKIIAFQESIHFGKAAGDIGSRQDLYSLDIQRFFDNIIIGTQKEIGGHSALLGRLSSLGLVGFIPYIMILYEQAKVSVKIIPSQYRSYYYVGTLAAIMMILTKAIASWDGLRKAPAPPMNLRPLSQGTFRW